MMKIPLVKSKRMEAGTHIGKLARKELKKVTPKKEGGGEAEYISLYVQEETTGIEIRADYPLYATQASALGKTLLNFGVKAEQFTEEGSEMIDLDEVFYADRRVRFETMIDERGFSRIVDGSLRPAEEPKEEIPPDMIEAVVNLTEGSKSHDDAIRALTTKRRADLIAWLAKMERQGLIKY